MRSKKITLVLLCVFVCILGVLSALLLLVDSFALLHQNVRLKNTVQVAETADITRAQTFYIDSAEDLDNVRENLYQKDENGDFILDVPNIFIQICDIDMTGYSFAPIGDEINVFNGSYVGNNFQISNLTISSSNQNVGLFAVVGENGSVSGVSIVNSTVSGGTNVGAIAGINNGTISLSSNYATISGTNVGGIAGVNNGTIEKSFNAGELSGTAGGISSQNSGTITNSFNMADFSGSGITNVNSGSVTNCYNAGQVSVGVASNGTVTNSYYLQGMSNSGLGTALSVDAFVGFDANSLAELLNGDEENFIIDHSYSVKFESGEVNYQFPHIIDNYINVTHSKAMKVSLDGRYHIIENTDMFNAIGGSYNNIPYSTSSKYILANNLDFSNETANDIESFSGEFNGNGKTISNINRDKNKTNMGLFDALTNNAYIHDLKLDSVSMYNSNGVESNKDISCGVLVGSLGSGVRLERVYVYNSYADSVGNTGGVVGKSVNENGLNSGHIKFCGAYNTQAYCRNVADAGSYDYCPVGGFIGRIFSAVNIPSSYITNCFAVKENTNEGNELAVGYVSIGGFIGEVEDGAIATISNCFSWGAIHSVKKSTLGASGSGNSSINDSVGGFIGVNFSSGLTVNNCYANVLLRWEKTWLGANSVQPRAFGHNEGGGSFNKNYASTYDAVNSSGANHELNANDFHSQFAFGEFDFNGVWSMGNIENVTNIPVPNQGGIQVLTDDNSTIKILRDNSQILDQTASEVNLSGLAYGNYKVEITRYGQNVSYTITLSADNKFSNIFDKAFYSGDGTETSPYIITNQGQFESVGNSNAFFVLKNNINAFGDMITPNGAFSGNFDGNGKKIYNFSINSSSENVGLFEMLSGATIRNLEISSFLVASQNSLNTGALAGKIANSQIENVTVDFGEIAGNSGNIGGLAGEITGTTISKIKSNVNITTSSQNGFAGGIVGVATGGSNISLSFSSGEIIGLNNLGGFVGSAENVTIQNSYTTSSVAGETNDASTSVIGGFAGNISANSSISTSFMYGSVVSLNGLGNVGVFAGENNSSNLQNNYAWNVNNYKIVFSGSGNGVSFLSTTDFAEQSSFAGFDFTDIWTLENSNYPLLKSA